MGLFRSLITQKYSGLKLRNGQPDVRNGQTDVNLYAVNKTLIIYRPMLVRF